MDGPGLPSLPGAPVPRRLIVALRDGAMLPYERHLLTSLDRHFGQAWARATHDIGPLHLEPLISLPAARIKELVYEAHVRDPNYQPFDFFAYYMVDVPGDLNVESVSARLRESTFFERVYPAPLASEPPVVPAQPNTNQSRQRCIDAAPVGISAAYARRFAGGDGAGQSLVDIEQGWNLEHVDLRAHRIELIWGANRSGRDHGTSVLGIVGAHENASGCLGVAQGVARLRVVGQFAQRNDLSPNNTDAIMRAMDVMGAGDVLLIEAQVRWRDKPNLPVEIERPVFGAIRSAVSRGIVVIEAAGNGDNDLDSVVDEDGQRPFDRTVRDSGAIIVGAATRSVPHERWSLSNYGGRVDCYSWGEKVETLTETGYTSEFSGTSSASAIVAGAALVAQGVREAALGYRFDPEELRTLFGSPDLGTPSKAPAHDRIGVMPDLRKLIEKAVNVAPRPYFRDHVGDGGAGRRKTIAASPDLIVTHDRVVNPGAAFGEGSGAEDATFAAYAIRDRDNFVYLRVKNRGAGAAPDVKATVYWAPVATLLTPELWSSIGETTLSKVAAGDVLTVSDAMRWTATDIPDSGYYALIAVLNDEFDEAHTPRHSLDWQRVRELLVANERVALRNTHVVGAVPGGPLGLPFLLTGPPDITRRMKIDLVCRLPPGSRAVVEMNRTIAPMVGAPRINVANNLALVVLNPTGTVRFAESSIQPRAQLPMRIRINMPERFRGRDHEVSVRQFDGEVEVGRITWRIRRAPGARM